MTAPFPRRKFRRQLPNSNRWTRTATARLAQTNCLAATLAAVADLALAVVVDPAVADLVQADPTVADLVQADPTVAVPEPKGADVGAADVLAGATTPLPAALDPGGPWMMTPPKADASLFASPSLVRWGRGFHLAKRNDLKSYPKSDVTGDPSWATLKGR